MTRPLKINGVHTTVLDAIAHHRARCEQTCARKARYPDEHVARAVGTEHMENGKAPYQLYIYQCRVCRGWHLTKQTLAPFWAADYYTKGEK